MIIGVGIDMVKVERIKSSIEKFGRDFLKRVFNEKELKNISKNRMYYQKLAARFAAKEAIIKAITEEKFLTLKDILILNKSNGAPYCEFKERINIKIFLSITHIDDYAVACAVAER